MKIQFPQRQICVAQTSKSAVSRISKSANRWNANDLPIRNRRYSRFGNLRYGILMPPQLGGESCNESRRDSINQPRVAEPARLPWVAGQGIFSTLKGLHQTTFDGDTTPLGLRKIFAQPTQGSPGKRGNPGLNDFNPFRIGENFEANRIKAQGQNFGIRETLLQLAEQN